MKFLVLLLALFPFILGYLFALEWGRIQRTEPILFNIEALEKIPAVDCSIVLTGGPGRIPLSLRLLELDKIKTLIISGVYPRTSLNSIVDSARMELSAESRKKIEERVVLERRSETTFGNAMQSLAMAEALGCRTLYLITSQVHMNRAFRTFQGQNVTKLHLIPFPSRASKQELEWDSLTLEVIKSFFYSLWAY
jgi:uncharacterized SAM-binding protein YcdF (DUF218 family)